VDLTLRCEVELVDLTESLEKGLLEDLAALCCFALDQAEMQGAWEVALVLTTDAHLTELHGEFMDIPEPTDIMTFPSDEEPDGDIIISVEQAERQRHDDGWELAAELRFLVVHGVLHLAGWDDTLPEDRAKMLARQRDIVTAFQSNDPSSNR
jgi:probable rRNA maturation factor